MVNAPRSSKIGLRRRDEGAAAGKKKLQNLDTQCN
jgi:hypothetical protein